jgi:Na+-driven multidrug efflux pump
VLRFSRWTIAAFIALIVLLFYTPLREAILAGAMGLAPELRAEVAPATLLFLVAPPMWALAATYRGLLAGARHTGVLAVTGGVRLLAVLAVSSACLAWPQANGAVVGVLALIAAFASEAALLGRSLNGHLRHGRAFSETPVTTVTAATAMANPGATHV